MEHQYIFSCWQCSKRVSTLKCVCVCVRVMYAYIFFYVYPTLICVLTRTLISQFRHAELCMTGNMPHPNAAGQKQGLSISNYKRTSGCCERVLKVNIQLITHSLEALRPFVTPNFFLKTKIQDFWVSEVPIIRYLCTYK